MIKVTCRPWNRVINGPRRPLLLSSAIRFHANVNKMSRDPSIGERHPIDSKVKCSFSPRSMRNRFEHERRCLLLRGQRICSNLRRRRRAFAISGIAWGTPATGCTRTFGTDHYESIIEDENGGPSVERLICDKIVGGLTTGWKLWKDASKTRKTREV